MFSAIEYLDRCSALFPDKTAVIDEWGSIDYASLRYLSCQIGTCLIQKGLQRKMPVPVLMEKGIPALASFLGAQYAGAFYVFLDPELPDGRLRMILKLLDAPLLITDGEHEEKAGTLIPAEHVLLYEYAAETVVDEQLLEDRAQQRLDIDPLYANFTSGSTGTPKGVLVSNRSVLDFIHVFVDTFHFSSEDIIANQAPFDFDVSVKDIYTALYCGATLVIIPRRMFSRPVELLDFLCAHKITVMIWAVSALCLITTFHGLDYKVPESVRKVLFSGEVMPEKHLLQWMEKLPEAEFVNLYGPTEITCNCTYHCIDRTRDYQGMIPIGRAFPNEEVFLLDGSKKVEEPGQTGEICVSGTALALGYYNAPEQTKKAFVQNPLQDRYPEIIYRTGDLACYNEAGELVFKGRKDFQIKYQGHRIELEEIERAMMQLEEVRRAVCVFDEQKSRLFGFYTGDIEESTLVESLGQTLAVWQIPKLKQVEDMPLTKNGKVDRKLLLASVQRRPRK